MFENVKQMDFFPQFKNDLISTNTFLAITTAGDPQVLIYLFTVRLNCLTHL